MKLLLRHALHLQFPDEKCDFLHQAVPQARGEEGNVSTPLACRNNVPAGEWQVETAGTSEDGLMRRTEDG